MESLKLSLASSQIKNMLIKSVCVFCGSNYGLAPVYKEQATLLGRVLAEKGIELIYGGAHVGLMGAVADGALKAGGRVTGILPRFLEEKELAHTGLSELILVDTMHQRKTIMNERCDAVITLPGGFGTMDELFEMLTWSQLGLHNKPIGVLNVNGYYDHLILIIENMVAKGFLSPAHKESLLIHNEIDVLLQQMSDYKAVEALTILAEDKI
jgi:uncharacterized protein (TIGR00730 family)